MRDMEGIHLETVRAEKLDVCPDDFGMAQKWGFIHISSVLFSSDPISSKAILFACVWIQFGASAGSVWSLPCGLFFPGGGWIHTHPDLPKLVLQTSS